MGSFDASLKTIGDTKGLPAKVKLDQGRLSIAAGDTDIGDWDLDEIGLEPTPNGYRLAAEGEQILLEISERELFADELTQATKKQSKLGPLKLPGLPTKSKKESDDGSPDLRDDSKTTRETPAKAQPPRRSPQPRPEPSPVETTEERPKTKESNSLVALLDRTIDASEKRWGPLLPAWVFNRIVFVAAGLAVILAFVFRGLASIVLLVAGVVLLMIGGAAYTDDVMASKLLPGRTTPTHALIMGIGLLVLGILFGLIA